MSRPHFARILSSFVLINLIPSGFAYSQEYKLNYADNSQLSIISNSVIGLRASSDGNVPISKKKIIIKEVEIFYIRISEVMPKCHPYWKGEAVIMAEKSHSGNLYNVPVKYVKQLAVDFKESCYGYPFPIPSIFLFLFEK